MQSIHRRRLTRDILIVVVSVFAAVAFAKSSLLDGLFGLVAGHYLIVAFIAGLFFTSSFTTAPAIVVLAKLCVLFPLLNIALVGAGGALLGDFIIFAFIKGHLAEDLAYILSKSKMRRAAHVLKYHFVRWLMAAVGALVIASPLPDELGLALMGISKISTWKFCVLSYAFNFLGILLIAFVARSVAGV